MVDSNESVMLAMLDIENIQQLADAECLSTSVRVAQMQRPGETFVDWLKEQQQESNGKRFYSLGQAIDTFRTWRLNLIRQLLAHMKHCSLHVTELEEKCCERVQEANNAGVALLYQKVWNESAQQFDLVRPCQIPQTNRVSAVSGSALNVSFIQKPCNTKQCVCCQHSIKLTHAEEMQKANSRWMHKMQHQLNRVEKMDKADFLCGVLQILQTTLLFDFLHKEEVSQQSNIFARAVRTKLGMDSLVMPAVFMLWVSWEFDIKGDLKHLQEMAAFFGNVFTWPRTVGGEETRQEFQPFQTDPSWADNVRNVVQLEEFIVMQIYYRPTIATPCNTLNRRSIFQTLMGCKECILQHLAPKLQNSFSQAVEIYSQACVGCQHHYAFSNSTSLIVNVLLVLALKHSTEEERDDWLCALHDLLMRVIEEENGCALLATVRAMKQDPYNAVRASKRAKPSGSTPAS